MQHYDNCVMYYKPVRTKETQYGNIDYKIHFSAVFSTFFSFQKPSLSSVQIYIFNILYHMSLRVVATFLCITCGV